MNDSLFKTTTGKIVLDKAVAHAKKRLSAGKSVFADDGSES